MSLAEELLADLEDAGDEDEQMLAAAENEQIDEIEEVTEEADAGGQSYDSVASVARLRDSANFRSIMQRIEESGTDPRDATQMSGPVEADPEYQLIVDANALAVEIDNEINVIHKFVRDKYGKRFPELENMVPMPMDYIICVKELGNDILEKAKNNEALQKVLPPATVIVVSVTASTTQGERLTDDELKVVDDACDMALDLNSAKIKIYEFIETRMNYIAPNLTMIVGANCAAKLMGVAGGLSQLCKMPACNMLVLGAQKRALTGFSTTAVLPHTGYIYYTPLVQSLPPDLRRKGARLVAAKCTLAARVDAIHSASDGSIGRSLADELRKKYEKILEPPPVKNVKPLPKPLDKSSKKRGGRRVRKMKERLGMTDMRRKANRVNFGQLEEDVLQDDMGFALGQAKSGGGPGGRLRAAQVDQKTKARMSKTLQKNLQRQAGMVSVRGASTSGAGTSAGGASTFKRPVGGAVSTVTFTPVQGIEIINPQANEKKVAEANAKYFGTSTSFVKVQTPLPGPKK